MAHKDHVTIIREGVESWNQWMSIKSDGVPSRHPEFVADLAGADLRHTDLRGVNLTNANLTGADLTGACLEEADLRFAELEQANLAGAILGRAHLGGANLVGATLDHAFLAHAHAPEADLSQCNLHRAILEGVDLSGAVLTNADLTNSTLPRANFSQAMLHEADLGKALLQETLFVGTDLAGAIGLEHCLHSGPSTLDFRTLARSGRLPEIFLRGCGLPDTLIEYLPSLLNEPIQFYSCFISFTEADDELAQRLYNDLQGEGVRCWRWKEDAKWGRSLMGEIDQAVRIHDKLVVLCSENSLKSKPVIREIERALQREDRLFGQSEDSEVLFPVRLDGYIFDGWEHPRKADVVEKTVGDFTDWKDHDKYQASFDRLLKSLKPDTPLS